MIYSSGARSILLILLVTIGISLLLFGNITSSLPAVPRASASPPYNPAVVSLFNEAKRSNAVVDASIRSGTQFVMDINITDAGLIKGFDINITWASTVLSVKNSTFNGPGCLTCLFNQVSTTSSNTTNNARGFIRLAVIDTDSGTPFLNGNGIMFRIGFNTLSTAGAATVIHIDSNSQVQNPSSLPYSPIDGYYDSRSSPSNFLISASPPSITVVRPISGSTTGTVTVTVPPSPTGLSSGIILRALSVPVNTNASFNPSSCPSNSSCSSTMTITVNGGARGGLSTAPSGTYIIPIMGNATGSGVTGPVTFLVRVSWLKLIIQPPPAPVYNFTASSIAFTQEAGNYTLLTLRATLSSGANDSVAFGDDCSPSFPGVCTVKPQSGSFPFTATFNVSTSATGTPPNKIYRFNATATSLGTYSEVIIEKNITMAVTVLKSHDLIVESVILSKDYSYQGVSLSPGNQLKVNVTVANKGTVSETFRVNATAKTVLTSYHSLKYVDSNGNSVYDPGEVVVVDSDGNGLYGSGTVDSNVRFLDSNLNGRWDNGEVLVYDSNADSRFTFGSFYNDTLIVGTRPGNNTLVSFDPMILFVDLNDNLSWQSGETIFYDANGNNVYNTGETLIVGSAPVAEPVIVGAAPALATVLSLKSLSYADNNFNGMLDSTETIVSDSNVNGFYDAGEPVARGAAPSGGVLVGSQNVTLPAGMSTTVVLNWDPGSLARGSYFLRGVAAPVVGEFSVMDNSLLSLGFTQKLRGDLNRDCKVNIVDVSSVNGLFGQSQGGPRYILVSDLNNDGKINIIDVTLVNSAFGQTC